MPRAPPPGSGGRLAAVQTTWDRELTAPAHRPQATPAAEEVGVRAKRRRLSSQGQLRDRIVQSVREWASQLDDDQLSGPDALDLCCGLFRRFCHSQLSAAASISTPEDAPWESLIKKLDAARKVELAACLWLALKLTVCRLPKLTPRSSPLRLHHQRSVPACESR